MGKELIVDTPRSSINCVLCSECTRNRVETKQLRVYSVECLGSGVHMFTSNRVDHNRSYGLADTLCTGMVSIEQKIDGNPQAGIDHMFLRGDH